MGIQRINQYKSSFDSTVKKIVDNSGESVKVWYAQKSLILLEFTSTL